MSESAPPPPPPENPPGSPTGNPAGTPGGSTPPPPPPAAAPPPAAGYGANPGAAPPPPYQAAGPQPGGLGVRFLARLIDGIIIGIVSSIITGLVAGGSMFSADRSYADYAIAAIIDAVLYLGYFAFMESSRGQTVGKMALKLHTEGPNGGKPTMSEAVKRNLWTALGILGVLGAIGSTIGGLIELVVVIVIAVQIGSNAATRQSFMDRFAGGTRVIKEG